MDRYKRSESPSVYPRKHDPIYTHTHTLKTHKHAKSRTKQIRQTLTCVINARNVAAGIRLHDKNAPRINDEGLITKSER